MRWKKLSDYAVESDCGNWRIVLWQEPSQTCYLIWRRHTSKPRAVCASSKFGLLSFHDSREAAMEAIQSHRQP